MNDESKKEEIRNKIKTDIESGTLKNSRPMGYIYPKKIQQILRGENPSISKGWTPEIDEEYKEFKSKENSQSASKTAEDFLEIRNLVKEYLDLPTYCPKCNNNMYEKEKKLNEKFYRIRKHCFECQLKFEYNIRKQGDDAWKKYEESIMIPNAISYLEDVSVQIKEYLQSLSNKTSYVTEEGTLETWSSDITKVKDFFESELERITKDIIELKTALQEILSDEKIFGTND